MVWGIDSLAIFASSSANIGYLYSYVKKYFLRGNVRDSKCSLNAYYIKMCKTSL